nr:LOW QUALITY PROTEIN: drebrin-like [Anas platyrhynchos]
MGAPGLDRHRLALLAAKEDVGNPRAATNWAVFAYEKHHDLKLLDSGAGGADELAAKFCASSVMYGLCRLRDPNTGTPRIVLISWVGEKTPESQRQACAGHLPAIRAFFREASVVLSARRAEEVTQEGLSRALAQLAPAAAPPARRAPPADTEELVGTNYRKTNPALEIRRTQRDSFWAQAEREEEQRKEEERRRLLEERRRWERERMEEERREAAEREQRFREKERLIEEHRKEQARLEAEERRKEKARWEQQQREHEEAMRERSRRSESIEKAAEAAVLVSQRPQNPRDFFRQRERAGSTSGAPLPAGPGGARPGARRPFLRYQRSLTESAFIFRRPEPPPSPSPLDPGAFRAAPPTSPRRPPPPLPASPAGTGPPPRCAAAGALSPAGAGPPPTLPGSPPPASPPGSGPPDGTRGAEPEPPRGTPGLGSPSSPGGGLLLPSPPWQPPPGPAALSPTGSAGAEALPLPSPPSTPLDEEGPPRAPLPSPAPRLGGLQGCRWGRARGPRAPGGGLLPLGWCLPRCPRVAPAPPARCRIRPSPAWQPRSHSKGPSGNPSRSQPGATRGTTASGTSGTGGGQPPGSRTPRCRGMSPATPSCRSRCTKPSQASPCCWPAMPPTSSCLPAAAPQLRTRTSPPMLCSGGDSSTPPPPSTTYCAPQHPPSQGCPQPPMHWLPHTSPHCPTLGVVPAAPQPPPSTTSCTGAAGPLPPPPPHTAALGSSHTPTALTHLCSTGLGGDRGPQLGGHRAGSRTLPPRDPQPPQ